MNVPRAKSLSKRLIVVSKSAVNATQQNTTLFTCTFPCTIVGLRWEIDTIGDTTTPGHNFWVIQVVKQGNTPPTIAVSDAADLVTPEQNVMAFGVRLDDADSKSGPDDGMIKTMRKLQTGDTLIFSVVGQATQTSTLRGIIQFFTKIN